MNGIKLILIGLVLGFSINAQAGWVFTEDSDGEKRVTYIQKNRIQYVASDQILMMDLNADRLTLSDPARKIYWSGKPEEFEARLKESYAAIEQQIQQGIVRKAGEEPGLLENALKEMQQEIAQKSFELKIDKIDKAETIAGYSAVKHEIRINGVLKQEKWMAAGIQLREDLDIALFGKMMRRFQLGLGAEPETIALSAPAVMKMLETGWPLKTVDYQTDIDVRTEKTVSVERKELSDEQFAVPGDYQEIALANFFGE